VTRFLVDEDFNNDLVRGLLRRHPLTDLVRLQVSNGLLLRKSGSEAGIIVERGADLVVIRMLRKAAVQPSSLRTPIGVQ
jgi:hypothetical protein